MPNEIDTEAVRAALVAIFAGALNRAEDAETERDALKERLERVRAWAERRPYMSDIQYSDVLAAEVLAIIEGKEGACLD